MLKFLEIYACLFIVFTLHECGHIAALVRYKCRIANVTIFYVSIIRIWYRNTFIRIGIVPGAYVEAAGTENLDDLQYVFVCLAGIAVSCICCFILVVISFWYQAQFLTFLKHTFLLDIGIGMIPWGNNDMARALKVIKSDDYGKD